jgi:RNA 3'-terminal phosphate cyclase-like protein
MMGVDVVGDAGELPEDIAQKAAAMLCEEIRQGGCIDSTHQSLCLTMMALTPEDVSRVKLGPLTPHTIETLRLIRDFFGVTFKLTQHPDSTVTLSCLGSGFKNTSRRVT